MDIRAVLALRDEDDIWEETLAHFVALCTHVYVVIQAPTDRIPPVVSHAQQRHPEAVSSHILAQQGYFRSEVSRLFATLAFSHGADWVLFADADEFVRASSQSDLESALRGHENGVVTFRRRNLLPSAFGSSAGFSVRQSYRTLAASPDLGKVAISAGWASRFPQFELTSRLTGVAPWRGAMPAAGPSPAEYLHIPVRSFDRLQARVEAGIAAYEAGFGSESDGIAHWHAIQQRLSVGGDTAALAEIALHYDALGRTPPNPSASIQTVEETAFVDGKLPLASPATNAEATVRDPENNVIPSPRPVPATRGGRLALLSGTTIEVGLQPISGRGALRGGRFETLPAGSQFRLDQGRINDAIGAAFQPVETPLAGDASLHVPALFFLLRLLAPRRYVELGSRQGATFFAACQAVKGQGDAVECVAIDSWDDGPNQPDGDRLFADFEYLMSTRYPQIGHYVCGQTDDAAWCFEDGSVDVLFIDACRGDAVAKRELDVWRPKLSDRGVILLHGTLGAESLRTSGAWQAIEATFPSWNLRIGQGLGVGYVGDAESEAVRLLTRLREDAKLSEALTEVARGAASLSQAESRRAVWQLVNSQLVVTKERLAKEREAGAQQATRKLRASLSWRLTAPLRFAGRLLRRPGGSRHG